MTINFYSVVCSIKGFFDECRIALYKKCHTVGLRVSTKTMDISSNREEVLGQLLWNISKYK